MPRIPDASQLDRPAPRDRRGVVVDRSAEIIGDAVQNSGARMLEAEDKFTFAQARNSVLNADLEARKSLENDGDWATYEQRYTEQLQKGISAAAGQIRSARDRALFEQEAKLDMARGAVGIRAQARQKEVDWGRAGVDQGLASMRESALQAKDPNLRWSYIENGKSLLKGAVDKGYITQAEATNQWQRWSVDYADGLLDTYEPEKQVKVLSNPDDPESPNRLLPADRVANRLKTAQREVDAKRREAEIEQRVRLTEAKQAMSDRFRDMQVAAQLGMPVDVPSRGLLVSLYGEQDGTQRYQTAQRLATLSGDVAGLQQLSTHDLLAKVDAYRPTQVEGAAEQAQMQQALAGSVRQILEQRAKDPAGYLTQQSPVVRRAWDEMGRDPAAAPRYIAAVRAEKDRLGILGDSVVPDSYVAALADDIGGTSAEKVADRLQEEAQRWGDAWPQVYGQVAGKLPPIAAVIGSGIPQSAATALAATANLKDAELKAMLPPSVKWADLQAGVDGQFEDFVRSMPPEATATVAATKDAAVRLTLKYMNAGAGRGDAVKRAYRDLVGSQYEIRDIRGYAVRIPAGANPDAVEEGAARRLSTFEPDARSILVPPGAALTTEEYATRYRDYVRKNGYWVTAPNAKGLRLYVDGGPVVTSTGAIDVPWQELAASAQGPLATTATRMPAPN